MFERLLTKEIRPTTEELALYCGGNADNYQLFNSYLSANFNTMQEIRFPYGNKYGWCITHRKGKKLICDVFAEAGSFTVMVRLRDQQFDSVYADVEKYTQDQIENRYPCGNGGWIHYRVSSDDHLTDIKKLINVKCD